MRTRAAPGRSHSRREDGDHRVCGRPLRPHRQPPRPDPHARRFIERLGRGGRRRHGSGRARLPGRGLHDTTRVLLRSRRVQAHGRDVLHGRCPHRRAHPRSCRDPGFQSERCLEHRAPDRPGGEYPAGPPPARIRPRVAPVHGSVAACPPPHRGLGGAGRRDHRGIRRARRTAGGSRSPGEHSRRPPRGATGIDPGCGRRQPARHHGLGDALAVRGIRRPSRPEGRRNRARLRAPRPNVGPFRLRRCLADSRPRPRRSRPLSGDRRRLHHLRLLGPRAGKPRPHGITNVPQLRVLAGVAVLQPAVDDGKRASGGPSAHWIRGGGRPSRGPRPLVHGDVPRQDQPGGRVRTTQWNLNRNLTP